jgi:mannose-1-phosphate guanylyltransferase
MFGPQSRSAGIGVREQTSAGSKRCCIVVANDKQPQALSTSLLQRAADSAAMTKGFLRLAARRATGLSSPANVLVCAQEDDRRTWEQPFWFTQPANRFISELGTPTSLPIAAAVLSIASRDPFCPVAVLPSDFWVTRESVLTDAIERTFEQLQVIPESVATLGMIDSHHEGHEDYLVVGPRHAQKGAAIQARINRPERPLAKKLISEGALVASGILLGYAQAFAARINKYWPHLAQELTQTLKRDCLGSVERKFSAYAYKQIPRLVMHSARLFPPAFPARAFAVQGCGWCSRKVAEM